MASQSFLQARVKDLENVQIALLMQGALSVLKCH